MEMYGLDKINMYYTMQTLYKENLMCYLIVA